MTKFGTAISILKQEKSDLEGEIWDLKIDIREGEIDKNAANMMIVTKNAELEDLKGALKVLEEQEW